MGFKIMTEEGWKNIPSKSIKAPDLPETMEQAERMVAEQGTVKMPLQTISRSDSDSSRRHKERMNETANAHNEQLRLRAIRLLSMVWDK